MIIILVAQNAIMSILKTLDSVIDVDAHYKIIKFAMLK